MNHIYQNFKNLPAVIVIPDLLTP
ncbi:uncharacterized protein METZ01_LOCUS319214, partial [marine metagenome]